MDIRRRAMHRIKRPQESGFTRVEGMVAAMISAVLVGVLFVVMRMNNDGVKYGAVNTKVRAQYEVAVAEIGSWTRSASAVLNDSAGETYPPASTLTLDTTSRIMMYRITPNGLGDPIRGYSVENGVLKEWRPEWGEFRPFAVGAWPTVSVTDAKPFRLSATRKTLTVSMQVTAAHAGMTAVAPARGEVFTCRN